MRILPTDGPTDGPMRSVNRWANSYYLKSLLYSNRWANAFCQQGTVLNHAHIFRRFVICETALSGGDGCPLWPSKLSDYYLSKYSIYIRRKNEINNKVECVYLCMWVLTKDSHTYILYHMLIELVENCWWHRWVESKEWCVDNKNIKWPNIDQNYPAPFRRETSYLRLQAARYIQRQHLKNDDVASLKSTTDDWKCLVIAFLTSVCHRCLNSSETMTPKSADAQGTGSCNTARICPGRPLRWLIQWHGVWPFKTMKRLRTFAEDNLTDPTWNMVNKQLQEIHYLGRRLQFWEASVLKEPPPPKKPTIQNQNMNTDRDDNVHNNQTRKQEILSNPYL